MTLLTKDLIGKIVRLVLGLVAGSLVAKGKIDSDNADQIIGALVGVTTGLWSWWDARHSQRLLDAAKSLPPNATDKEITVTAKKL